MSIAIFAPRNSDRINPGRERDYTPPGKIEDPIQAKRCGNCPSKKRFCLFTAMNPALLLLIVVLPALGAAINGIAGFFVLIG